MKRILFVTFLCFATFCLTHAENNDEHLKQLVQCINDSDFVCAAEQLPLVENWTFDWYGADSLAIDKALLFAKYAEAKHITKPIIDSLKMYAEQACYRIGVNYENNHNYEAALPYYELSSTILKEVLGNDHPRYAEALFELGNTYSFTGNSKKAEHCLLGALKIRKKILPESHPDYANSLEGLGGFYFSIENYKKAEKYFLEYAQVCEDYYRQRYLSAIENLWFLYDEMGDERKAKYYETILYNAEKDEEAEEDELDSIEQNGDNANGYERFVKAKLLSIYLLKGYRLEMDENDLGYAFFTFSIGEMYMELGDWKKAEENLLEAMKICENMEKDSIALSVYTLSVDMLGLLNMNMGDYPKAEMYFLKANNKPSASTGMLYMEMGDYTTAEKYLLGALNDYTERNTEYAICSGTIGDLYLRMHNYPKAEKYLLDAFQLYRDSLHTENLPFIAVCLNNIGKLYISTKDYLKAKEYLSVAEKVDEYIHSENHPNYIETRNLMGELYFRQQDYPNAESYYVRSRDAQKILFARSVEFMSDLQRSRYWATVKEQYECQYPNFSYRYYTQKPSISTFSYDNELYTKGLLLSSSNAIRQSILGTQDSTLIQEWEQVINLQNKLHYMQQHGSSKDSLTMIEQYAEEKEKKITRKSAAFRENMRQWSITWDSVRAALKTNQVAIEYMRAPLNEDSTMYCALLLRDTCSYPVMIPLFEEKEVSRLLHQSTTEEDSAAIRQTYTYRDHGGELTQLIWEKTMPFIREGEVVFFAPTGILHQIAIENLPYDTTYTMTEKYNLVRLSSTRELAMDRPAIEHKKATLYGDIRYSTTIEGMVVAAAKYRGTQRDYADDLPGTKKEIAAIDTILEKQQIQVQIFTSSKANEESVKALSGSKQNILHFATHGFYWQDSTGIDPMERCGLLFAGANNVLIGSPERLKDVDVNDGILTAKELSVLDFRNADIVVMSACETGLGEINGEGVFGLQRAFKMAGAKTIMMSLWQVSDDATRLLMTSFYRNLSQGMSKREAFRSAQQEVRNYNTTDGTSSESRGMSGKEKKLNKGKMGGGNQPSDVSQQKAEVSKPYASPYYWAGFILLD